MGIARSTSSQASGKGDSSAADSRQLCESAETLKIQYVIEAQRPAVSEIRVPTKDGNASVVRHGADPPRGLEMFDGDANAPPQGAPFAPSSQLGWTTHPRPSSGADPRVQESYLGIG